MNFIRSTFQFWKFSTFAYLVPVSICKIIIFKQLRWNFQLQSSQFTSAGSSSLKKTRNWFTSALQSAITRQIIFIRITPVLLNLWTELTLRLRFASPPKIFWHGHSWVEFINFVSLLSSYFFAGWILFLLQIRNYLSRSAAHKTFRLVSMHDRANTKPQHCLHFESSERECTWHTS